MPSYSKGVQARYFTSLFLVLPSSFENFVSISTPQSLHISSDNSFGSRVSTKWCFFRWVIISSSFIPLVTFTSNGTSPSLSKSGVIYLAKSSTAGPRMPGFVKIKSSVIFTFECFFIPIFSVALAIVSALHSGLAIKIY